MAKKIKYFLPILTVAFCYFTSLAQQNKTHSERNKITDSLLYLLKSNTLHDTAKINILNNLALKLESNNADSAIILSNQALLLAQKNKWQKGICRAYTNLGRFYQLKGNCPLALDYNFKALKIRELLNDKQGISISFGNIGLIYFELKDIPKAQEYHFKALKIAEELGDKNGIARHLGNIGLLYHDQGNYSKALENYFSALKITEKTGDKDGIAYNLSSIGQAYLMKGNWRKALDYNLKSLKITEELGDKNEIADRLAIIGNIYAGIARYKEAEEYFQKALTLCNSIGALYFISQLEESLSEIYTLTNQPTKALEHYKKYIAARDSLFNEENTKKIIRSEMNFDFEKKEAIAKAEHKSELDKQNAIAEEKSKKQKIIIFSIMGGLLLVLVFSGFIFRSLRITRKQKQIIEIKEQETQQQNSIINKQKHLIEEKHKEIKDSINYAERIQRSLLASNTLLNENLKEYFVLFQPKDIVSGDFYWAGKLSNGHFALLTADSTGHGVPGAIMSILNISCLEKAIEVEKLTEPAEILNHTRTKIIEILKKDGSAEGGKDGMDCSLISFDYSSFEGGKGDATLMYAAANNPVWIVRDGQILLSNPDKMPVGKHDKDTVPFIQHTIPLQKGDMIYTITDGYADQFGGPDGKKFMSKRLKELLISISHLPMEEQKEKLNHSFHEWKGGLDQVDDVTVIGVKVNTVK